MGASSSPIADTELGEAGAHNPRPSALRRACMNAIACAILYGNAMMALQPPPLQRKPWALQVPGAVRDAFLLFGMFNSYSARNPDFFVSGLPARAAATTDRSRWLKLRLRDHFSQRHGVTFTQFVAAHHWDMHGRVAQRAAWATLTRKIRERHNRMHPDQPIARVLLGGEDWPQSPKGFRANKHAPLVRGRTWYIEPKPK